MLHTVIFCYGTDHPGGIACGKGVGGDIPGNNAAGTDDTVLADGYTGADNHIGADPAVMTDDHRFGIAQMAGITLLVQHGPAFVGQHGVDRGYDGYIGPEAAVITDGDRGIVLDSKIEVDEYMIADKGMAAVMEGDGTLKESTLTNRTKQVIQNGFPLLDLVFIKPII